MPKTKSFLIVLALLALATESQARRPRSQVVTPADVKMGSLLLRSDVDRGYVQAPTVDTKVRIRITGLVGRTRVAQVFRNPSEEWVEGVYVFPLPEGAAVDTLRMKVGERVIEGQIQERAQARRTYEKAKREGKKASLLEQERPNIFTVSLAHIGPLEDVRIELEYQEEVRYEAGRFDLRFPMVVGPRYIPGAPARTETVSFTGTGWAQPTRIVTDADRITPPVLPPSSRRENPVELEVELHLGMPLASVESSSHAVKVEHQVAFGYHVTLIEGIQGMEGTEGAVPANRDFTLSWSPDVGAAPRAALFNESVDGDNYVLLMLMPPSDGQKTARLPRETIFVIDTSGSMNGTSIEQARGALLYALDRLQPDDTFNVIQFNSSTSKLGHQPVHATPDAVERARSYVRGLDAGGDTEMMSALTAAFGQKSPPEIHRVRQIIFITDGSVGNEAQLFDHIQAHLGDRRLFTVGIGSAPNAHFMTRAAKFGRGTFTYVGTAAEVSTKMEELFGKLESPVLSHIELDFEDPTAEIWPKHAPDLYAGEPIVVAAKVRGGASGLDVRGRRGEEPWGVGFQLRGGKAQSGVARLWARRKIADLMDTMTVAKEVSEQGAARAAIVDVALRHHLVSRFTSLVAVDVTPSAPSGTTALTKPVPTELPAGWSRQHVVGSLPQGATAAELLMLLGFLALTAGLLIFWSGDKSCKEKRSVFSSLQ